MSTPLSPPENPAGSRKDKAQEMDQLQDAYDQRLGLKPRTSPAEPLYTEKHLSKASKDLLDSLDPKPKEPDQREPTLYKETEAMAKKQASFDKLLKNGIQGGAQTPEARLRNYYTGPVSPEERLRSWHRAIGTRQEIVEQEVAQLKKQKEAQQ